MRLKCLTSPVWSLSPQTRSPGRHIWYAEKERKDRDWDLKYMRKFVPQTVFREFAGMDHGDMALFQPERFAEEIRALD